MILAMSDRGGAMTTKAAFSTTAAPAAALSSCARNVFTPGVYYFNFPSSNPVWNVNSVIGGTLAPGGLTCDPSKPGVEFVFGGQSSVVVGDGATFILCASPNASSQQIALYGVGHVKTPTLVLHGDKDERVPSEQGFEFYTALVKAGVPTELVVLPRQPHGPREPRLLKAVHQWHLDWLGKYTLRPSS